MCLLPAGGNEDGTAIDIRSNWATVYDSATQEAVGSAHVFAPTFSGSMSDMFLEIKVKRLDYPRFVDIHLQVTALCTAVCCCKNPYHRHRRRRCCCCYCCSLYAHSVMQ
jgi:hypothetical protein